MISIKITYADNTTTEITADHISLREEVGISIVNGTPQTNGQSRFSMQGWTGVTNFGDFKTEATTEVNK